MADNWYKRDVRSAIKGMQLLTLEERGAYNTIIDHQYLLGGPLHDDDRYLSGLMGCDVRVWRRVKEALLGKERIVISDGLIEDLRVTYELARRDVQRKQRVRSGQLGGIASGKSRKSNGLAEACASTPLNQIRGEESIEEEEKEIPKTVLPKRNPSRLPKTFEPKPEAWQKMKEQFSLTDVQLKLETDIFCDHWKTKGGTNSRKLNWDAAWRNWIRKSIQYRDERRQSDGDTPILRNGRYELGGDEIDNGQRIKEV